MKTYLPIAISPCFCGHLSPIGKYSIHAWNPKQRFINGCFNWMIPNLYIGNCCFTKHPFLIYSCLGFQVEHMGKAQDYYLCVCHRFHRCLHSVHQQLRNQRDGCSLSEATLCRFGTLHANLVPKHFQRPDLGRRCRQDAQAQLGVGISLCCLCYLDGTHCCDTEYCSWVG